MQQLQFKISELVSDLSDEIKQNKLTETYYYKKQQINIRFRNLERGLYFVSGTIKSEEDTEFVHVAEKTNEWTIIYFLEQDINAIQKKIPAGVYTIFDNHDYKITLEANSEPNIYLVIVHREYLKIYNFLRIFDILNKKNTMSHHQALSKPIMLKLKSFEKNTGLIKTKQAVFDLITLFSESV